jgi:energy-converting hydrogenase Eha subunit E
VSYLKYNLSIFLLVFIHYLAFTIYCVTLRVFFPPQGPAAFIFQAIPMSKAAAVTVKAVGVSMVFVTFTSWLFYILMLLKSFIFNVYHIVMTGVALTIDEDEQA